MIEPRPLLITGAGGFVGRQVVRQALALGHQVVAMDSVTAGIPEGARIVAGDLGDQEARGEALGDGVCAVIHLATVPGGAAEADPAASRRINLDASYDLLLEASAFGNRLRFIFASSIAVFGDPMPAHVDDATPLSPKMIYGGHKAMIEQAVALFTNRAMIDGLSLRLPGILARPQAPSGMKSAFISNLFHALKAGEAFVCPVSPLATIWAQSLDTCARNVLHGLMYDPAYLPPAYALTLPALRFTMGDLVEEIARQCGSRAELVSFVPEPALEAAFGAQPPLFTPAAERAGFVADRDLGALVASALTALA